VVAIAKSTRLGKHGTSISLFHSRHVKNYFAFHSLQRPLLRLWVDVWDSPAHSAEWARRARAILVRPQRGLCSGKRIGISLTMTTK